MNPFPITRKIITVPGCDSFRIVLEQDGDGDVEVLPQSFDGDLDEWKYCTYIWQGQKHILAQLGFPTEPLVSEDTVEGVMSDAEEEK